MIRLLRKVSKNCCFLVLLFLPFYSNSQVLKEIDSTKAATEKLKDDIKKVDSYIFISDKYLEYNIDESINFANKAYELSKKLNYQSGIAYSYLAHSQINRVKRNFSISLQKTYDALDIFEKEENQRGIAATHFEFGYIYKFIPNYKKAENAVLLSLKIYEKEKDTINIIKCETQLAHIAIEQLGRDKDTSFFFQGIKYYFHTLYYA